MKKPARLAYLNQLCITAANGQLIAANGQLHRVAQRRHLAHVHLRAAGQSHVHDAALERALAVQLLDHCVFSNLDILQRLHLLFPLM